VEGGVFSEDYVWGDEWNEENEQNPSMKDWERSWTTEKMNGAGNKQVARKVSLNDDPHEKQGAQ
jgi:hypothetical protein